MEAELLEQLQYQRAVADRGLDLVANLHRRAWTGPLNVIRLVPASWRTRSACALPLQRQVARVEQAILLQAPVAHGVAPRSSSAARASSGSRTAA